jgi:hypothetical protein
MDHSVLGHLAVAFLRIARSPPLYDAKVATAAGSLLPYAVVLHSLVAMWVFSNAMIFQSVRLHPVGFP